MINAETARQALERLEREHAARTNAEREAKKNNTGDLNSLMGEWKQKMTQNFFHRFDKYVK